MRYWEKLLFFLPPRLGFWRCFEDKGGGGTLLIAFGYSVKVGFIFCFVF